MPSPVFPITVPGSSANLGPGFDALGMAVSLTLTVSRDGPRAPEDHPAVAAFRSAGGTGPLSVASDIPVERGLGFSGAARVAGLLAAGLSRHETLAAATGLEGHADNVAASLLGGVVAVAAGRAVRVPLGLRGRLVAWVPETRASTDRSRQVLPRNVPFEDAVFNVGRVALLVAALAAGDPAALLTASEDRLHQDRRLADLPDSLAALEAATAAGAWAAWLSGSGPAVAALCPEDVVAHVTAALPPEGEVSLLGIDEIGARGARDLRSPD